MWPCVGGARVDHPGGGAADDVGVGARRASSAPGSGRRCGRSRGARAPRRRGSAHRPRCSARETAASTASRASSGSSTTMSPAPLSTSRTSQEVPANGISMISAPSASSSTTVRSSRTQRARSGETQTRATRASVTSPSLSQRCGAEAGASTSSARLEVLAGRLGLLGPVEAEVADGVALAVAAADVPALRAAGEPVGLDLAGGELVLVLLVVLDPQHRAVGDRVVDGADDLGLVALDRDLQALLGGIVAERRDDLVAGRVEALLRQVVAEEVDRGDERLRLERQQPRAAWRSCRRRPRGRPRSRRRRARRRGRRCRRRS